VQLPADHSAWQGHTDGVILACTAAGGGDASGAGGGWYQWAADEGGAVNPVVVAQAAVASLSVRGVSIASAPPHAGMKPDTQPIIGIPVWLWVGDPGPSTTGPNAASVTVGRVTVSAAGVLDHIEYDLGDGTVIRCGVGTVFAMRFAGEPSPTCGHTYEHTSGKQPGGVFTIVATSFWTVTWFATIQPVQGVGGDGDGLGEPGEPVTSSGTVILTVSSTAGLPMGELQTIITE
jgi:hypothetical protein